MGLEFRMRIGPGLCYRQMTTVRLGGVPVSVDTALDLHNNYWGLQMAPAPAAPETVDWDAVVTDARFQRLHHGKSAFLWGLMVFSVIYYFALPIGAAYYPELFRIRVWGVINVGLLFALSQFVIAWTVAVLYSRRAGREFDPLAAQIVADHAKGAQP
jgi:uncharacterized membrane protein (DUF485 family)